MNLNLKYCNMVERGNIATVDELISPNPSAANQFTMERNSLAQQSPTTDSISFSEKSQRAINHRNHSREKRLRRIKKDAAIGGSTLRSSQPINTAIIQHIDYESSPQTSTEQFLQIPL